MTKNYTTYDTNFEQVTEFHQIFGGLIEEIPTLPTDPVELDKIIRLRWKLIDEEYEEIYHEFFNVNKLGNEVVKTDIDLTKVAKELCDLLYVVYGAGVSFGIDMDACFAEVHRSNLSKLDKDGNVLHREDGKVMKSDQYKEANIQSVFDVQRFNDDERKERNKALDEMIALNEEMGLYD